MSAATETKFRFSKVTLLKDQALGRGSYGSVCKAKCDTLTCAAKIIHSVLFDLADPGAATMMKRFQLECQLLAAIKHPNIVQCLGTHTDPATGLPVLLMELMDHSLTHFLKAEPPLPFHTQVNLSLDVASALAYLHSNRLLHRDLSGNNILLLGDRRAKVTDFGMSKLEPRMTPATMCPGTLVYMPPEALDEKPHHTYKLDTFSFGVVLIQILTGQFPAPSDRFTTLLVPDPSNKKRTIKVQQAVNEVKRRQNHIRLVQDSPLLGISLACLQDRHEDRPTASVLVTQLEALQAKNAYQSSVESVGKEVKQSIQETREMFERLIEDKNYVAEQKDRMIEDKERAIQEKDRVIADQERAIREKDHTIADQERAIREKDRMIADQECAIRAKDCVIAGKELIILEKDRVIADKERANQEKDRVIADQERAIQEKDHTIEQVSQDVKGHHSLLERLKCKTKERERMMNLMLEEKDITIEDKEQVIQEKDRTIEANEREKDRMMMDKECVILEKDRMIVSKKRVIQEKDCAIEDKKSVIWEKDRITKTLIVMYNELLFKISQKTELTSGDAGFTLCWKRTRNAPVKFRGQGCTVVIGSKAYFHRRVRTKQIYEYDTDTESWHTLPPTPEWIRGCSVVSIYNLFLTFISPSGKLYTYTSGNGGERWVEKFPSMGIYIECRHSSCISTRDKVIVFSDRFETQGHMLDLHTLEWTHFKLVSPKVFFWRMSRFVHNDIVYQYTDFDTAFDSCPEDEVKKVKDGSDIPWKSLRGMPHHYQTPTSFNGHILALGGRTNLISPKIKSIYRYDVESNSWAEFGEMEVARSECMVAVVGNKMVVVGGEDGQRASRTDIATAV